MFSKAVKLFSIGGFDIRIDPSWLIIAALISWSLSQHVFPETLPGQSATAYLTMGLAATALFFGSLLLHELAHSVIARQFGLTVGGITLFLFGGVAEMESEPKSPKAEFLIAIVGPSMSVALSIGFYFLSWIASLAGGLAALTEVLSYLGLINLVLALFNLVPAFPLDGGRMLRAYLWQKSDDLLRATETASKAGILFAFVLMAFGVMALFQGALLPAIWQIMIGGFLLVAARASYQTQLLQVVFDKRTVGDLMQRHPVTVDPDVTLSSFVNQIMLRHGISFVPVVEDGVLLGHIDHAMLSGIDREHWSSTQVGDVFAGLDAGATVSPDMPVEELLKRIAATGRRKFLVADGTRLIGVISLSDLARHIQLSDLLPAT